ncbi:MAG TPA: DUF1428 domain-containing protein [Reyranella sp.]|nr:DUF1428 domain-containing protein [Reyranella sp.]
MPYIEGCVSPVPAANKDAYRAEAAKTWAMFREFGVTRMVESWGNDVPDGKLTDFKGAVKAGKDEVVVFSWLEYPDKATRDSAGERMRSDPRMKEMGANMPFDGKRMIFGGFMPIVEMRSDTLTPGYVDGSLLAVPTQRKEAYRAWAEKAAHVLRANGATRIVEAWGDDVPEGKTTDFRRAVQAKDDETVVFCWIEWPSKAIRDIAWQEMANDPHLTARNAPFDGQRRISGGFMPILDT